ncbi:PREDICTED: vesicle-associated membrane protein 724-like [Ipomoea nil]|uniref:vesicle-associated membrane protein 724-like n=1 Tax=Ipomoea nil TaxID=35883 RepID=UPI00090142D7|nr:PREDICTED: vesicle-associated membrane protein 724-like [Ipomoea nil]
MVPESFLYSFVARGTVVLAESHTEFAGNFRQIALHRLQELPSSADRFTYNYHRHTFTFLVEEDYTYCVVVNGSLGTQSSIAFLENVKTDFKRRYGGGKADTAAANSLDKEFGPVMKEQMQYMMDEIEKVQKVAQVSQVLEKVAQVSQVKCVMYDNIVKAFESDKTINLPYNPDELRGSTQVFRVTTNQIHRNIWRHTMKIKLVAIGIIFLMVLLIIWLSI